MRVNYNRVSVVNQSGESFTADTEKYDFKFAANSFGSFPEGGNRQEHLFAFRLSCKASQVLFQLRLAMQSLPLHKSSYLLTVQKLALL